MWVVSMLIVWGGAALFLWWNAIQTEAQVRQMARAVASTLAVTIGNDWENTTHMETTVHLASRQDGVAYVKVRLPSGGLRTSAGDPGIDPSQVWVESEPITHFNQQLGSVEVAVSAGWERSCSSRGCEPPCGSRWRPRWWRLWFPGG